MEDQQKTAAEERTDDDDQERQHGEPSEEDQRPEDLDPKDEGEDVQGGGYKFI